MLVYKIDVIKALRRKGYTTGSMVKDKVFGYATIDALKHERHIGWKVIDRLCRILDCQPGDILEYVPDEDE